MASLKQLGIRRRNLQARISDLEANPNPERKAELVSLQAALEETNREREETRQRLLGYSVPHKTGTGGILTKRMRQFVEEYIGCGFDADVAGAKLQMSGHAIHKFMHHPRVQALIHERLEETHLTADAVIARLSEQARAAYAEYLQPDGGIDLKRMLEDGQGHLIRRLRKTSWGGLVVEFYNAQAALVQLAKIHGLFKSERTTADEFGDALAKVLINLAAERDLADEVAEEAERDAGCEAPKLKVLPGGGKGAVQWTGND